MALAAVTSHQFRRSVCTTWGLVLRRSILGIILKIVQVIQLVWQENDDLWSGERETLTQVFGVRQVSIRLVLGLYFITIRIRFLGILRLGAVVPGMLSPGIR